MPINRELFERVKAYIREEPRRFDMSDFIRTIEPKFLKPTDPPCGTACCIAGAANLLTYGDAQTVRAKSQALPDDQGMREMAEAALGISDDDGFALFFEREWPVDIYREYLDAKAREDARGMAEAGCKAIDWFLSKAGQ